MPFDPSTAKPTGEIDKSVFNPATAAVEPPKTQLGDLGRKFKAGVEQLPGLATGIADIVPAIATGTRPFTAAADYLGGVTGFTPGKWAKEIQYSDANAQGAKNVDEAWTGIESAQKDPAKTKSDVVRQVLADAPKIADAYIRNPMYTAGQVVESVPSMLAGGVASKGLMVAGRAAGVVGAAADAATGAAATAGRAAVPGYLERTVGEKMADSVAAGVGEGIVTAGQQMDQYEGGDQRRNALASLAAGAGTGAIGVAAGRAAHAMGLETSGTAMARIGDAATTPAEMSAKRRILGGMISESVLQELPQSAQEQVWQNYADGKPLMDGVLRQGIEGALAGAVMGAGANLRGNAEHATDAPPGQADELATTPPSPTPGLPSSPEAEAQPQTQEFNSSAAAPELAQDAAPTVDPALAAGEIPASVPVPTIEDQALDTEAAKRANRLAAVGVADTQPNSPLTNAALAAVDSGAHGAAMAERAATQAPLEAHQPPPVRQQDQAQQAPLAHAAEAVPLADTGTAPAAQSQTSSIVPPSSAPLNSPIAAAPTPQERIAALSAEIASSKDATGKPLNKLQVNMRRTNMRQLISDLPADQIEAARAQHDAPPQELTRATDIATGPARVLQNRDRSTAASIGQMNKIASAPDYLRAGQASVMESGAPVVFGATPKHALVGKEVQITDGTGKRTPVQYAVVEAEDVLPSHQADGTPIAKYQNGVPGKLRAVAGNGRAAGITAGYQRGTAAQYRQDLTNDATDLGVDPQAVSAMKAPVLVRVMPEELVTDDIGDRSNIGGTAALSATEQAANDARRIDLSGLTFDDNGIPDRQSAAKFVNTMPVSERGAMMQPDGSPTRQLIDRITSAAFKAAYGNDDVVRLQAQSTDTEIRNIITAMARVAGPMAGLEGAGDFDVRGAVSEAAQMAVNAKRGGISLTEYLNNADMGFSGEAFTVAQFMAENIRSAKNMADGLRAWVDYAAEQVAIARENQVQDGLFGATPTASRGDTFNQLGATSEQPSAAQISNGASRSSPVEDRAPRQEAQPAPEQNLAGDFEAQPAQVAEAATQQPEGANSEPQANQTQPQQTQPETPAASVPDEVARPAGWRNNRLQAGAVAHKLGIDAKGMSLAEVVAAVERADAPAQSAPAAPEAQPANEAAAPAVKPPKAKKPTLRESVAQAKAIQDAAAQAQPAKSTQGEKAASSEAPKSVAEKAQAANENKAKAAELREFNKEWRKKNKVGKFDTWEEMNQFQTARQESRASASAALKKGAEELKAEFAKFKEQREANRAKAAAPDTLTAPTPRDIIDQQTRAEAAQAAEIKTKTDAENKAKADEQVGEFALTGSDRAADVGTAGGQEAMFLRNSAKQSANSSKAMASVQTVADRISANWHNAPEIIVATSMDDPRIPQAARDEDQRQRAMGATGSPEGFVHGGKVYLLADQLASPERAATVLMHEALGHIGLQGVFGDSLKTILQQVATMRQADIKAKAKQYGLDMSDPAQRLQAAEEVLAEMAQSRPEIGFVKRAVAAIRNWLRANVPGFKALALTDAEIVQQFILPARRYVTDGVSRDSGRSAATSNSGAFNPDIRFSRSPAASPSAPAWATPEKSGWFDDLTYKLQDKQIDTKRVIEAIRTASGALADERNVYLQESLYHGRAAARSEDFVNKELGPLVNAMRMRGLDIAMLDEYLHARHAEEANALIADRNPDIQDGGSGMTTADARAYLAGLDAGRHAKLEVVAAQVDAILARTRQLYADYSLESQKTIDGWGAMFANYVPLMREDDGGGTGIGQGFSIKGRETRSRTGSTRKVVDILANIAMQRERAIVRGEKNRVATALVGLAEANPNKEFWHTGPPPLEKVYDAKLNKVVSRPDPMYKSRENVLMAKIKKADGTVIEKAVVFNEDSERAMRMSAALKNLDAAHLEGLLGVSAKVTRYFSAVNTQFNPIFGVVNLTRDVQSAILNLSSTPLKGKGTQVAKHVLSALAGVYQDARAARNGQTPNSPWAALHEEFRQEGGQTGFRDAFTDSNDRANAIRRELNPGAWMDSPLGKIFTAGGALKVPLAIAQKRATGLFGWLSDYNLAMENAVRLSAYKVAREQGMSKQQAASLAKELTVNFNRKGQVGSQAGAVYAFFNASMQGTARLGETLFTMDPGKPKTLRLSATGRNIVLGGVTLGVMQALLLSAAGFDDEEPPDFVRERSLIVPTGWLAGPDKGYITIPMPLGLHVLPNMGRIPTEFALNGFKNPEEQIAKLLTLITGAFNPVGGGASLLQTLAPTPIDPLAALAENRDWTGKPIARTSRNPATPGHLLTKDTASYPAKVLAEAINVMTGGTEYVAGILSPTPDQIDYLWSQVTGGVGREVSKTQQSASAVYSGEDLPIHKIPLAGRFFGNTDTPSAQSNKFYSAIDRLNRHEEQIKGLRKDGRGAEVTDYLAQNPEARLFIAANAAERQVQELRGVKRNLVKKDAPAERIKLIETQISSRMTAFNELMQRTAK